MDLGDETKIKEEFDSVKKSILEENKVLQDLSTHLHSRPDKLNTIMATGVLESFNKITTWFFAINVGTLLWLISNFDKFRPINVSPTFMPYKYIYILSIIFLGLSSILLAIIQCISYWTQHKFTKRYDIHRLQYDTFLEKFGEYAEDWNKMVKGIESSSKSENMLDILMKSKNDLTDLGNQRHPLIGGLKKCDESLEYLMDSYYKITKLSFSEYILIFPVILYILGIVSVSAYIILFIYKYM